MNFGLIFIQILGLAAWLLILLSYHRKDTDMILVFHILAATLFAIHYLFLDAYSGFVICTFEMIRDYLYYKTDKDKYIFLFSTFFYVAVGIFIYGGLLSLFPLFASFLDGFFLTKKKKIAVLGSIIVYILWFVYDIFVKSYAGMFADLVVIISNSLILFFNYNIYDQKDDKPVTVKH